MELNDKYVKRVIVLFLLGFLGVLVFLVVKPLAISIIWGLILAYAFFPLYSFILKYLKGKNISAAIVSIVVLAIIIIPTWFLIPIMVQQIFRLFTFSQNIDLQEILRAVFPSVSDQFLAQTVTTLNTAVSKASSSLLNYLINWFIELPTIAFNVFIAAIVFFFALRDSEYLAETMKILSPFNKNKEKIMVKNFKDITDSLIYGQIIVGLAQGIFAGLGFLIFGVQNALVLSVLAIIFSIIPFIGPSIIWAPVAIFIFTSGNIGLGILFLLYNLLIVSLADNFIRSYLVSKKTDISTAILLIGMIGGFIVFGFLGLIIGPLILAYFLILLRAYKDKTLSTLFMDT